MKEDKSVYVWWVVVSIALGVLFLLNYDKNCIGGDPFGLLGIGFIMLGVYIIWNKLL